MELKPNHIYTNGRMPYIILDQSTKVFLPGLDRMGDIDPSSFVTQIRDIDHQAAKLVFTPEEFAEIIALAIKIREEST